MSNCKDSIELLLRYLDGDLPGEVREELDKHFGDCAPCEEFLATYRATPGLCACALKRSMPEEVAQALTAVLRAEAKKDEPS